MKRCSVGVLNKKILPLFLLWERFIRASFLVESAKNGTSHSHFCFCQSYQFEPHEDFNEYPRDREGDCEKLKLAGVDAVFFPNVEEIYPHGEKPNIPPLPLVFSELEGAIRPNHFLGVAQVLFRFFYPPLSF